MFCVPFTLTEPLFTKSWVFATDNTASVFPTRVLSWLLKLSFHSAKGRSVPRQGKVLDCRKSSGRKFLEGGQAKTYGTLASLNDFAALDTKQTSRFSLTHSAVSASPTWRSGPRGEFA